MKGAGAGRLIAITLDQASLASAPRAGHRHVDLEREVAINDLMALNSFLPVSRQGGDFRLTLSVIDGKLVWDVSDADGAHVIRHILSMAPFRRVVRDYFIICEAYYEAVASAHGNIEAIDVGRRGLHNEGAEILQDRLAGKISVDFETARRLFTLITALHWKG